MQRVRVTPPGIQVSEMLCLLRVREHKPGRDLLSCWGQEGRWCHSRTSLVSCCHCKLKSFILIPWTWVKTTIRFPSSWGGALGHLLAQ